MWKWTAGEQVAEEDARRIGRSDSSVKENAALEGIGRQLDGAFSHMFLIHCFTTAASIHLEVHVKEEQCRRRRRQGGSGRE